MAIWNFIIEHGGNVAWSFFGLTLLLRAYLKARRIRYKNGDCEIEALSIEDVVLLAKIAEKDKPAETNPIDRARRSEPG